MRTNNRVLAVLGTVFAMSLCSCIEQLPTPVITASPAKPEDDEPPAYAAVTWKQKCMSYIDDAQRQCTNTPEVCTSQEYKDCINEISLCYALYDYGELPGVQVARFNQVVAACKTFRPHIVE
jgi:predicted lipoprotein